MQLSELINKIQEECVELRNSLGLKMNYTDDDIADFIAGVFDNSNNDDSFEAGERIGRLCVLEEMLEELGECEASIDYSALEQ